MRRFAVLLLAATILGAGAASARTYDLVIDRQKVEVEPGRKDIAITLNGGITGPALHFTEGETATIRVTNHLKETTSIHWHGLLVPGGKDGSPGFNGFAGIKPGETYTYTFDLRQTGTYWYHAHSATQEQAGQYGALIIDPKAGSDIALKTDRDQIVLLSEHTRTDPERILRNLKGDSGYYNFTKRTTPEFFRDVGKFGLKKTLADRRAWNAMRMDPTDIADVGNYTLLVNGLPTDRNPSFRFTPGEKVRLRIINGSAMSFMDVRMPGLTMTVVAADGRAVEPVKVDEFRIGVAETYDVVVEPKDDRAYPLWVETLDRKASVLAALAPRDGMTVTAPASRPRQVLLMSEMGSMGGMAMGGKPGKAGGMAGMDMSGGAMTGMDMGAATATAATKPVDDMAGMDMSGDTMAGMAMSKSKGDAPTKPVDSMAAIDMSGGAMPGMDMGQSRPAAAKPVHNMAGTRTSGDAMAGMDMGKPKGEAPPSPADAMAGMDMSGGAMPGMDMGGAPAPAAKPTQAMAGMDMSHGSMTGMKMDGEPMVDRSVAVKNDLVGTAVVASAGAVRTPFPKIDYGMGADTTAPMNGMAMGDGGMPGMTGNSDSMAGMAGMSMPALAREGETDGSGRVFGWATGAPYGARVLSVRDLRSLTPQHDTRAPTRDIVIKVSGNMERYIWTLNGAKFGEAPPIKVDFGERVRITFANETMMAHPMHLHGMFFQVENGQPMDRLPDKNVVTVAPGKTQSILLTADEAGEWPLQCHLLYHMESGMMQKLVVASVAKPDGTPGPAMPAMPGMSPGGAGSR